LTDPSYAGRSSPSRFPHIGNVGTNEEDIEALNMAATPGARGVSSCAPPSRSLRTYRATAHLDSWLSAAASSASRHRTHACAHALIRQKAFECGGRRMR